MSLFWGFDWLVDRKRHSIICFLRRSKTNNCIWIAKLFWVSRNWWKRRFFSREMLAINLYRDTFPANVLHRLAGIQKNNEIFQFQFRFNSSAWMQPEVGELPGWHKSTAWGHRFILRKKKKKLLGFLSSLLPISSARITFPSAASRGVAAGQSGPKRRAPLMAFIKAALWMRRAPAHWARRSRTAAQIAGVKHRYVRPAALALILAASSAAPHPARLPADGCCLCISSADHFPAIQRSRQGGTVEAELHLSHFWLGLNCPLIFPLVLDDLAPI